MTKEAIQLIDSALQWQKENPDARKVSAVWEYEAAWNDRPLFSVEILDVRIPASATLEPGDSIPDLWAVRMGHLQRELQRVISEGPQCLTSQS